MTPGQVREEILKQHRGLRERLDEIERLSAVYREGDERTGRELRDCGLALYEVFASHLQFEDARLKPALEASGSEGAQRARRLEHEHRDQRELLQFLSERMRRSPVPSHLVARELANFVEYLRSDMAHEEEAMLDEKLLGAAR